jgi:hypothetical protein
LQCYGAGAYRGCIVLSHIALFDGLRAKIKAIAPVNSVAKAVSDAIEPLAEAQQVFELPLIQKLKTAGILTTLEAQTLEQLNKQRNKAAHPSGHVPTAEEARYVFSEAIQKFLSQPIRQTSYVVKQVTAKISDPNFFPSSIVNDMKAVVEQEIETLDPSAFPFLVSELSDALASSNAQAVSNSRNFLLVLASRQDPGVREQLIKKVIDPKCSQDANAEFFTMLIYQDPRLLADVGQGTLLRLRNLLAKNMEKNAITVVPYVQLRNPAHVLVAILSALGEDVVYDKVKDFAEAVAAVGPPIPPFIAGVAKYPKTFGAVFEKFVEKASSGDFNTANAFAGSLPSLDDELASALSGAKQEIG